MRNHNSLDREREGPYSSEPPPSPAGIQTEVRYRFRQVLIYGRQVDNGGARIGPAWNLIGCIELAADGKG